MSDVEFKGLLAFIATLDDDSLSFLRDCLRGELLER